MFYHNHSLENGKIMLHTAVLGDKFGRLLLQSVKLFYFTPGTQLASFPCSCVYQSLGTRLGLDKLHIQYWGTIHAYCLWSFFCRCSLFLLDPKRQQLVATVFDSNLPGTEVLISLWYMVSFPDWEKVHGLIPRLGEVHGLIPKHSTWLFIPTFVSALAYRSRSGDCRLCGQDR